MSQDERSRPVVSRREVLRTGAVAGAAAAFGGMAAVPASAAPAQGGPAGGRDDADLALVNGKIHTMDAENAVVSTVLIRDGRILAVGNRAGEHG
ncbi:MAG: amidohydrolase, partial [Stackebrandtia sp.]